MSDSVRPHRRQPTRLPHPWDSPGKNTGVGCHFLLQCMKVKRESEVAQSCPTLSNSMDCSPPGSSVHGIFQARVREWGAIVFSRYGHEEPHIPISRCWMIFWYYHSIYQKMMKIETGVPAPPFRWKTLQKRRKKVTEKRYQDKEGSSSTFLCLKFPV